PHVPSRVLRIVLAASMVLLPVTAAEALANAANLHWFLICAACWAVIWVPSGWVGRVVAGVVLFFALTSDPFPLVLGALLVLRMLTPLPARDKVHLLVGYGAGAAVQLFGVLTSSRPPATPSMTGALKLYPLRVVLATATGFDA